LVFGQVGEKNEGKDCNKQIPPNKNSAEIIILNLYKGIYHSSY